MLVNSILKVADWCPLGIHSPLSDLLFPHFIHRTQHVCLWSILKMRCICFDRCLFWGSGQSSAWFSGLPRKTCDLSFVDRQTKLFIFFTLQNNYFPLRHTMLNSCLEPDSDMAVRQEVGWSGNLKCSSVINPDSWNICWINVKDSSRHSCCKL